MAVLMMRRTSIMLNFLWYKFNTHLYTCQLTNKKTTQALGNFFLSILTVPRPHKMERRS